MNIDYGFDDDIITLRSVKSTGKLQDYDQIQGIKWLFLSKLVWVYSNQFSHLIN